MALQGSEWRTREALGPQLGTMPGDARSAVGEQRGDHRCPSRPRVWRCSRRLDEGKAGSPAQLQHGETSARDAAGPMCSRQLPQVRQIQRRQPSPPHARLDTTTPSTSVPSWRRSATLSGLLIGRGPSRVPSNPESPHRRALWFEPRGSNQISRNPIVLAQTPPPCLLLLPVPWIVSLSAVSVRRRVAAIESIPRLASFFLTDLQAASRPSKTCGVSSWRSCIAATIGAPSKSQRPLVESCRIPSFSGIFLAPPALLSVHPSIFQIRPPPVPRTPQSDR